MAESAPIIFIPGATSTSQVWNRQREALADYACQEIDHVDLDSIPAMAERVLQSAPKRFALCGTSMGGYVALSVARAAPERITKLILCNTNVRADHPDRRSARQMDIDAGPQAFVAARMLDEHFAAFVAPKNSTDKNLISYLRAMSLEVGYGCFVRHQTACMNRMAAVDFVSSLRMPTLVIGGSDDMITPPEQQQEIASLMPQAQIHVLDDCGHIAHLEKSDVVTAMIKEFLQA